MAHAESIARRTSSEVISRSQLATATIACPLKPMMCEPARLIVTSSACTPLMRSASSTARLIDSTAASGLTITPLRRPRESASPTPRICSSPSSPGPPTRHVTLLVPISSPIVWFVRLAIGFLVTVRATAIEAPAQPAYPWLNHPCDHASFVSHLRLYLCDHLMKGY